MMQFQDLKTGLQLSEVAANEGLQLKQCGDHCVCLCPFHPDKNPSFVVYPDHFHCYGCGAHGDAIDFIRRLRDLNFPEALQNLGIKNRRPTLRMKEQARQRRIERQQQDDLERWIAAVQYTVQMYIRVTERVTQFNSAEDLERSGHLLHSLDMYKWWQEILTIGSMVECRTLREDIETTLPVLPVKRLFHPNFDCSRWLREVNQPNEKELVNGAQTKIPKPFEVQFDRCNQRGQIASSSG